MEGQKTKRQLRAEKIQRAQRDISRLQRAEEVLSICVGCVGVVLVLITPRGHYRLALIRVSWLVLLCLAVQLACTAVGCAAAGYAIFLYNRIPREFIAQPARQKRDSQIARYWEAIGGLIFLEAVTLFFRLY